MNISSGNSLCNLALLSFATITLANNTRQYFQYQIGDPIKKILIVLFILILIVGAGAALFVSNNLDDYIASQIEQEGSAALGSKVSVSSVQTSLTEGSVIVNGLTIANPVGYSARNALELQSFSAKVDYQTQIIEQIDIVKPQINAEVKGGKNNFQELLDSMPDDADDADKPNDGDELELTIKQLSIRQASVNLRVAETKVADRSYKLDDQSFVMNDLIINNLTGTADELSEKITSRLTEHVSEQVKGFVTDQIKDRAKEELKAKANEKLSEILEGKLGDKLKGLKLKSDN